MQPVDSGRTRARKIPVSSRPAPTPEPSDLKTAQTGMPFPADTTTDAANAANNAIPGLVPAGSGRRGMLAKTA